MMDNWFPQPLTAFEMEARRAAAEEGRFPPNHPTVVPIQYTQNVDYTFPRVLSRSYSHSSSGTPPPYIEDRKKNITPQVHADPEVLNRSNHSHPNCSNQYLPISVYNEEYINYQPKWKGEDQSEPLTQSVNNYSVVCPTSTHPDLQLRKRPSNALQVRPIVNTGFHHQSYSPSSSPLSAYNQVSIGAVNPRPKSYPASYTFINQVFKPLYKSDERKELGSHPSHSFIRDGKSLETTHQPMLKVASSKDTSGSYQRVVVPGGRKAKRSNEKRFPCPDCGRMFARAFNMETHRKTHIGYRLHHCPQCQKSFSRRHDLHRHLSAVHNEQSKSLGQNSAQPSSSPANFEPDLNALRNPADSNTIEKTHS